MILALIALAALCGIVYATPGALPPAGNAIVRYSRIAVGSGMLIWALGRASEMAGRYDFSDLGYLVTTLGLGVTAWVIHVQACRR